MQTEKNQFIQSTINLHSQSFIKNIFLRFNVFEKSYHINYRNRFTKTNYKKFIFFLFKFLPIIQICFNHFYTIQGAKFFWVWSETMCHDTKYKTSFLTYTRPMGTWQLLQPMKDAHVSLCIRNIS